MQTDLSIADNHHLSEPNKAREAASLTIIADNFTDSLDMANEYVRESLASNTRKAYLYDLGHFEAWGGAIPASPELVAGYLAQHAGQLAIATLVRRIASISKVHEARSLPNPCRAEIVRATLRGIRRRWGCAQDQAKALVREDLFLTLDAMGAGIKDARDRALLLIGFAGGFRRSELVALDRADVQSVRQGLIVTIRRSKTDQEGQGRNIGVPYGSTRFCPILALERWLEISGVKAGAIFRPIDRHGHIAAGRLSGDAISVIVKKRVAAAGYDPADYSGHSLRAGFVTSAAMAGKTTWKIRQQTGHASESMLFRYVRDVELFRDHAASQLL
jgi:integrase